MSHRTLSATFSVIYCIPAFYTILRWAIQRPMAGRVPAIVGVSFGGFAALVLTCTLILPSVLSRLGHADQAIRWRSAASAAIVFGTVFTFVWTILYLPGGSFVAKLAVALGGCTAVLAGLLRADQRWLPLGMVKAL